MPALLQPLTSSVIAHPDSCIRRANTGFQAALNALHSPRST